MITLSNSLKSSSLVVAISFFSQLWPRVTDEKCLCVTKNDHFIKRPVCQPWKHLETNLNPGKPIKTDMEPWKTNLEPSKLTWSCTGWLLGVQVVTGDSQEEVMIFRYTHTLHHNIYIIIIIPRPRRARCPDGPRPTGINAPESPNYPLRQALLRWWLSYLKMMLMVLFNCLFV